MLRKVTLHAVSAVYLCLGLLLLASCGVGGFSCTGDTPVPTISSVSPNTLTVNDLPVTITVKGGHFKTWSVVNVNGSPQTTQFVNSSQLNATLGTDLIHWWSLQPGSTLQVNVTTAGSVAGSFVGGAFGCSNGGTSGSVTLTFH